MLCGIDEAGRGCLAGPLVVAGCVLKEDVEGLTDSKKLNEAKRESLYEELLKKSEFITVCISNEEIDTNGLSLSMKKALETIKKRFSHCEILFDGNTSFNVSDIKTLIKADLTVKEVSGASILAKVTRDRILKKYDTIYPEYGFLSHKGYATPHHVKKIEELGLCPIHRSSFKIKSLQTKSLFDL